MSENFKLDALKRLQSEAVKYLRLGKMSKLILTCNRGITASRDNPIVLEFIKLRGIGYAETGRLTEAKSDFLTILEIIPKDGPTLSNYLAACFSSGDMESVSRFFVNRTFDARL
jgi:hypothetical protein